MKKLKIPVLKNSASSIKTLSMDDYLKFVQFNLKNNFNQVAYAKWKKMLVVNVPFVLR